MAHENDWIADQHELEPNSWSGMTWSGLVPENGNAVWSIGDEIYYSNGSSSNQYVLNKTSLTWEQKTWSGLYYIYGYKIWTDGDDYFYSNAEDGEQYVLDQNTSTWNYMMWSGFAPLNGAYVWTDGENTYYSQGSSQYVFDKTTTTWSAKTWSGLTSFDGNCVWTDGENIYYSKGSSQYVLDKATATWSEKAWNGYSSIYGSDIWCCGEFIFFSRASTSVIQYVLDKATSTWTRKTWDGIYVLYWSRSGIWSDGDNIYYSGSNSYSQYKLDRNIASSVPYRSNFPEMIESVDLHTKWVSDVIEDRPDALVKQNWGGFSAIWGQQVWTDGENIYYLGGLNSYVLNRSEKTWEPKTWYGLDSISGPERTGSQIWTDGENIYYSDYRKQFVLDKATSTWTAKAWNGRSDFYGSNVWTDGENIYLSGGNANYQYVLDKATSTWEAKTWSGYQNIIAGNVWFDGDIMYYSAGSNQYVFDKATSTWIQKTWYGFSSPQGSNIWSRNGNVYYSDGRTQYVLDRATSTWSVKTWEDITLLYASGIWTDGEEMYYSYMNADNQYRITDIKITTVPYRYDFPEMIESTDIDNAWITHDEPDPATEGLRFLKLTYHLTVNWEGNGTNNITVSTDIPEAFKRSDHLWIYSGMNYRDVAMVINTEIPQCPYQCRMTFDSSANELVESLNNVSPKFYIYRTRNASRLAAFSPQNIDSALYSESIKNVELVDDRTYLSTPYNYACEPRVMFNFGDSSEGGELIHHSFPEEPGSTVVTIDIIFAFTADQDDRYADLLARYPDHLTPFEYIKNAVPYRPAFPELVESVDISDKWLISDDIPFRWNFPELIRSTANPVEPPSFFTFKGRSSAEFGSIEILPLCLKHEEKTDFINFITGTPYVLETSILRSKVITITLNLKDISPANIDRVNSWLIGTGKLVLSHDPHRYYIATCNNALTGQKLVNTLGKVAVQFNVMPYKYDLKEKESFEPVDLAEETLHKTAAIYYKGSAPAESTFKITATGNIEIYNVQTEKTVEIKGLTEYCIIDIKARKVTDENDLNILDRTYGDIFDLMLAPGDNYFFISGSVTAIGVKKKTRWY